MEFRILALNALGINSFYSYVVRDTARSAATEIARPSTYEMRATMTAYRKDFSAAARRIRDSPDQCGASVSRGFAPREHAR